jgi:pyruvate-formate lyase-activating enzyme
MQKKHKSENFDGRDISDSICIIPFISLSVNAGGYLTRCQMSEQRMGELGSAGSLLEEWNGPKLEELREKMKKGDWDPGCKSCMNKEGLGLKSKRKHWMNIKLAEDLWKEPSLFEEGHRSDIFHVDIAFSNYCNFRCRMCGPAYSSRWIEDESALLERGMSGGSGGLVSRESSLDLNGPGKSLSDEELLFLAKKMKTVRRIEVLGGEPFLTREFLEFLRLCREHGVADNTELMVTTNGSVISEAVLDMIAPFDYVNLNISIDATGSYFSYMRSSGACSWAQVEKNVKLAIDYCHRKNESSNKRWKVNINGTFQTYNMLNITNFLTWIEELYDWSNNQPERSSKYRDSFEHRILMGPRHLSVLNAPNELVEKSRSLLKQWLKERSYLNHIDESNYLKDIQKTLDAACSRPESEKRDQWYLFCWYTSLLDEVRGESLSDVDPDLNEFVNATQKLGSYQDAVKSWQAKGQQNVKSR